MAQKIQFLKCEDGIYIGKPLKNGTLSADARKVTREEIAMLFSEVVQDYCLRNQKPMLIERGGKPFIEARLVV